MVIFYDRRVNSKSLVDHGIQERKVSIQVVKRRITDSHDHLFSKSLLKHRIDRKFVQNPLDQKKNVLEETFKIRTRFIIFYYLPQ
jgi:hypothetical protein